MKTTGKRLKQIRKEKKLSQKEISELLGIKRSTYSNLESKVNSIPETHLINFSEIFGVSLNWLLRGIGPKYIEEIDEKAFGEYGQEIAEMFNELRKDKSMMHKMLGFYLREKAARDSGYTIV